jgi:Spy/CpxP family protein refolding chaperone
MRISYFMGGLLSFALALSFSVAAQTPAASSQQQPSAMPSQGATGQQGATTPGSAAPATPSPAAPGQTSTTPGTTPGTAQPAAQTDAENPLNLTEEQKTKLRPILMDERQQMEAVRNDTSLSPEQKMAKVQQIRETASPKIKAVLTPEQLKKLADMQQAGPQQNQNAPPKQ